MEAPESREDRQEHEEVQQEKPQRGPSLEGVFIRPGKG